MDGSITNHIAVVRNAEVEVAQAIMMKFPSLLLAHSTLKRTIMRMKNESNRTDT